MAGGIDYVSYLSMQKVKAFDSILAYGDQLGRTKMQDLHTAGSA